VKYVYQTMTCVTKDFLTRTPFELG
jgi:hypothetical protein